MRLSKYKKNNSKRNTICVESRSKKKRHICEKKIGYKKNIDGDFNAILEDNDQINPSKNSGMKAK